MANVQFDNESEPVQNQNFQQEEPKGDGMIGFVQDKLGGGKGRARKILLGLAAVVFLASLFFWFRLLF